MLEKIDVSDATVARICHEVNRAYCEYLGDHSQPEWPDAPDWQRQSAINGVRLHRENPDTTPEMSHEAWMSEKLADGWVYGETKDPEKKTHPCMLPYSDLPEDQKVKDVIFRGIVRAFG